MISYKITCLENHVFAYNYLCGLECRYNINGRNMFGSQLSDVDKSKYASFFFTFLCIYKQNFHCLAHVLSILITRV